MSIGTDEFSRIVATLAEVVLMIEGACQAEVLGFNECYLKS